MLRCGVARHLLRADNTGIVIVISQNFYQTGRFFKGQNLIIRVIKTRWLLLHLAIEGFGFATNIR